MKISEKLSSGRPSFSFEFFPPKGEAGMNELFATVAELRAYEPSYVSVTWGAGGSTRRLTVDLVGKIKKQTGIETMAHLTCVGATCDDLAQVLDHLRDDGIDNVLPLRGDPPRGEQHFVRTEGGFGNANELVEFIRKRYDFCLAGACYPETHPEAGDAARDLENLKRKVDAGVDFLITQLFFDNADYFAFVERARAAGVDRAIVAGIMPITNFSQIKRFTAMCGARIPEALVARLEAAGSDSERVREIGIEYATEQCRELLAGGAPGIHFYTLNRSPATKRILENLLKG
jgi:methylenetetrahydrofolate reductase (NADPH)